MYFSPCMAWICNISRCSSLASLLLSQRRVLRFLSCFKVLNGFSVLKVNQSHCDHGIPAVLLARAPKVNLLIVCSHNSEVHELPGALHTIHFLNGLQLELFALVLLLSVGVDVQAVRGENARLPLPELEEIVAPLFQLSFLQDVGNIRARHFACVLSNCWVIDEKTRIRMSQSFV